MRVLFIHQNFPGQFKWLAHDMSRWPGHEVMCLGDALNLKERKQQFSYPVMGYKSRQPQKSSIHHYLASTEVAVRRGQDVVRALQSLRSKGFVPDLVIGHPAWGEMLFVRDVFPNAKLIAYFEFFYHGAGSDVDFDPEFASTPDSYFKLRIRNTTQLHALSECDAGISPTQWQRSTYPMREQPRIHCIHEGLDLQQARPREDASFALPDGRRLSRSDSVVTYVSRNLEPYRGFHTFMRALPDLQRRLPATHFVIVGADGVSYGRSPAPPHASYREQMLKEVGTELDHSRVHFVGRQPYAAYLSLMQISRLHIYLTYPFVLSWSMLEAMACGAPVLGSATAPVQEVIRDGENGYLFDFFDRAQLVEQAVRIIGQPQEVTDAVRRRAQLDMAARFVFQEHSLPAYKRLIDEVMA